MEKLQKVVDYIWTVDEFYRDYQEAPMVSNALQDILGYIEDLKNESDAVNG